LAFQFSPRTAVSTPAAKRSVKGTKTTADAPVGVDDATLLAVAVPEAPAPLLELAPAPPAD
jgi:hypothetical protein